MRSKTTLLIVTLCLAAAVAWAQSESRNPDDLIAEGMQLQRDGETAKAMALYAQVLAADPDNVSAHWEIGWSYWMQRDWAKVVEHWSRVKQLDPAHEQVDRHLPVARDNLKLAEKLARMTPEERQKRSRPEGVITIAGVGDIMMGTDFPHPTSYLAPDDGAGLLSDLARDLSAADITFANLEGPLADCCETLKCKPGAEPGSCFAFRSPTRYAKYLVEAGIDVVSIANNHAMDFGPEGRAATMATLDKAGIRYSGPPGVVATLEARGLRVGVVAFAPAEHSHDLRDIPQAAQIVKLMASTHDLVVVSFHGGAEGSKATHVPRGMETFFGENRGDLRAFAHAVVDAGADLVLGHGPHVLRGMELYQDRLIAYSLGNFCTYGRFGLSGPLGITGILYVDLEADGRFAGGRFVSVKQIGAGDPVLDPEEQGFEAVAWLSGLDFGSGSPVFRHGRITLNRRMLKGP